jgi:hypothetical protein
MSISASKVSSVEEFIVKVRGDSAEWPCVWFRGEPGRDKDGQVITPLIPRLYRPKADKSKHQENKLLQTFRRQAPSFSANPCPDREATDQWLFLAQHVGLPTRLLDWSEGALVGLYFALQEAEPVVWMIPPHELNKQTQSNLGNEFPITWLVAHVRAAWENDPENFQVPLPIAIQPTAVHQRMTAQRSCFTIQGKDPRSLTLQLPNLLKRYDVEPTAREAMQSDLRLLGVGHSTVFPDLDRLAKELRELY